MADDRERNQGMKQGDAGSGAGKQGGQGNVQEAPARNPGQDQQTGGHQGDDGKQPDGVKEGGQNEETRR